MHVVGELLEISIFRKLVVEFNVKLEDKIPFFNLALVISNSCIIHA